MEFRVKRHRLYDQDGVPVPFVRSPNQSGKIEPEFLVMHYTAGASAQSSVDTLINPATKASAHLVIGRDGAVTQLVDFNRKAWHAGKSRWGGRSGVNAFSIGIELDNAGKLTGGDGNWRTWFGARIDDREVMEAYHKNGGSLCGWHVYTEAQLSIALDVARALIAHYGLVDIIGHDDVAPLRKSDPGPAFPMNSFHASALGREEDAPELYETLTELNIRTGPSIAYEKLPQSPLPVGAVLESHGTSGVWHDVDVLDPEDGTATSSGWVHGRYLGRHRPE